MLRDKERLLLNFNKALDLILVAAAFLAAYFIKKYLLPGELKGLAAEPNYLLILVLAVALHYLTFRAFSLYEPIGSKRFHDLVNKILKSVAVGILLLLFCLYLVHYNEVSRLLIGIFTLLLIILLTAGKAVIYFSLRYQRQRDCHARNVLIVGCGRMAVEAIKAIAKNPASGYRILGCLEVEPSGKDSLPVGAEVYRGVKVIGSLDDYTSILLARPVDEIIFARLLDRIDNITEIIRFAEKLGIIIRIMPDFQIQRIMYRPETARIFMDKFVGMPTIVLSSTPAREGELVLKSAIDYLGAALGLVALSPLLLAIALAVKVTSPGPVLFTQERCGLHGRLFRMFKFRTMYEDAEKRLDELKDKNEMDGPVFKMTNDPRVSPIGRFLRRTSLDELPQLINVLRGEMSLVGPRPPIPEEVEQYKPWQRRRLSMKPGLTCLWQVNGRNGIDFEKWMRLDLQYIDNWSLWLDMKLLAQTVKEVFMFHGR
ncbi:MAG: sugar transferase [Desulfobulbaceae bacterium]|jgi:exopolysaccharide biosynthesis polyprenyl glycosylphosphotransferase|nr:sugar transferase [Desulfobulbaceae bacterium]